MHDQAREQEGAHSRFEAGRASVLVPIYEGEHDPWRVQATVCMVNGSCVDAARGVTATSTATGSEVNN